MFFHFGFENQANMEGERNALLNSWVAMEHKKVARLVSWTDYYHIIDTGAHFEQTILSY